MKRGKRITINMQPAIVGYPQAHFHFSTLIFLPNLITKKIWMFMMLLLVTTAINAQQNIVKIDTVYQKLITERTAKIVNTLAITDSGVYKKVHQQLINQYVQLNSIHDNNKTTVATIKAQQQNKELNDAAIKIEDEKKSSALMQLHQKFIAQLTQSLSVQQIETVKDGMTYRVLPVTWGAYMDMLPQLSLEQKDKMYAWLLEARELAMDEGSSEKKHAVFGKYKGRINNYLSAAGYNMKKEGEDWAKRIQAAKQLKQTQNNL